jgi:integrase
MGLGGEACCGSDRERLTEVPRVKPLKEVRNKEPKFLSADECERLEAATTDYWRPMIFVARMTGLRSGELRALRWKHVDLDDRTLHVREADYRGVLDTPKHDKERVVALADSVVEALRGARQERPSARYVFPTLAGDMRNDRRCIRSG